MSDVFFALSPRLRIAVLAALAVGFGAGCDAKKPATVAPPVVAAPAEKAAVDAPVASRAEVVEEIAKDAPPWPAGAAQKLDAALVRALQKPRAAGARAMIDPDVPVQDGKNVLVEIKAAVSKELLEQVALLGGKVIDGAEAGDTLHAMIPFAQLAALAGRAEVTSISPGTLTVTSKIGSPPSLSTGALKTGPQ